MKVCVVLVGVAVILLRLALTGFIKIPSCERPGENQAGRYVTIHLNFEVYFWVYIWVFLYVCMFVIIG